MTLTTTNSDFYIYNTGYSGRIIGEIKKEGTLEEIKSTVFEMLDTTPLPSFPVPVYLTEGIEKPSNTVLLIEIEENQAYRIMPNFGNDKISTSKRTYAGGLLNIIAKCKNLFTQ